MADNKEEKWITLDENWLKFSKVMEKPDVFYFREFNRFTFPDQFLKYTGKSNGDLQDIWDVEEYWIESGEISLAEFSLNELLREVTTSYNGLDDLIIHYQDNSEEAVALCIFDNHKEQF